MDAKAILGKDHPEPQSSQRIRLSSTSSSTSVIYKKYDLCSMAVQRISAVRGVNIDFQEKHAPQKSMNCGQIVRSQPCLTPPLSLICHPLSWISRECPDTRKVLTPGKSWHQRNAGTREMLKTGMCWYQRNADTRKVLASGKSWRQRNTGIRSLLGPGVHQNDAKTGEMLTPE
jgi:hypothetical protein